MSEDTVTNGSIGFYGDFPESWSEEEKAAMRLLERGIIASVQIVDATDAQQQREEE